MWVAPTGLGLQVGRLQTARPTSARPTTVLWVLSCRPDKSASALWGITAAHMMPLARQATVRQDPEATKRGIAAAGQTAIHEAEPPRTKKTRGRDADSFFSFSLSAAARGDTTTGRIGSAADTPTPNVRCQHILAPISFLPPCIDMLSSSLRLSGKSSSHPGPRRQPCGECPSCSRGASRPHRWPAWELRRGPSSPALLGRSIAGPRRRPCRGVPSPRRGLAGEFRRRALPEVRDTPPRDLA